MVFVWLFLLGGVGVLMRFAVVWFFNKESFPYGILLVNVFGSFGMGWLYFSHYMSDNPLRVAILVGFFGALTTFSSFSLDVLNMIERGNVLLATLYLLGSNGLALGGCWLGMKLARMP